MEDTSIGNQKNRQINGRIKMTKGQTMTVWKMTKWQTMAEWKMTKGLRKDGRYQHG
jgi:hypothetical protein